MMEAEAAQAARVTRLLQAWMPFRGGKALAAMVLALTRELGLRLAFVTERREPQAHALAMADRQDLQRPVYYDSRQSPCRAVLDGDVVSVPCNVADLYPGEEGLQSYVGVPLVGSDGSVLGLVAVMDEHAMADAEAVQRVLLLLAPRIAAELECVQNSRGERPSSH